jgi:hypothetical protein
VSAHPFVSVAVPAPTKAALGASSEILYSRACSVESGLSEPLNSNVNGCHIGLHLNILAKHFDPHDVNESARTA